MGHFDRKNYIISVKLRESCSDSRIIDWQLERDYTYTIEDVKTFEYSTIPHHNPLSEKILHFFIEYGSGIIALDKWNTFEPIKHDFKLSEFNNYVGILSYPSGNLFLKKNKKYTCHITNEDYGFWWFDGKSCRPKVSLEYLVEIKILLSKQSKPKMEFMQQLTNDMAEYFCTDYARIIDQEIASKLPPLYEKDQKAVIYDVADK